MENHENSRNSEEAPEFEFGSLTPSSPSQDSFTENSPADHLFFNGRLLPHAFSAAGNNPKLSVSRTTSEYTSRSNSTNSRSSICSSSSTSYSPRMSSFNVNNNNSPLDHKPLDMNPPISMCGKAVNTPRMKATEMVTASLYRSYSSQRWQYITPAPVKRSRGIRVGGGRKKKAARMKKMSEESGGSRVMKWWRRLLMAAIFACRECHALEGA
ncbi:unnamed protein product [Microthlaspi erraticum]|uniref:Uncharacterized protein n=1 Tax=Microthlaspi erraticum TaxID=1685480 RepID=A0A6D2HHC1_9BRAS|nr:unnamed protein product [Microthlaspi erraticum]